MGRHNSWNRVRNTFSKIKLRCCLSALKACTLLVLSINVHKVLGKINNAQAPLTNTPGSEVASKKIFMSIWYSLVFAWEIFYHSRKTLSDLDDYFNHLQNLHHGLLSWEVTTSKNRLLCWSLVTVIFSLLRALRHPKAFKRTAMYNIDTWSERMDPYEYSFSSFPNISRHMNESAGSVVLLCFVCFVALFISLKYYSSINVEVVALHFRFH